MLDSGLRRNDSIGAERVAMNLWSYILKRVLLMIPTLLGVIAITFAVIQFVPGGPVEQALIELKKVRLVQANLRAVDVPSTAGGRVSILSGSKRSRPCTVLINRRLSASGKC